MVDKPEKKKPSANEILLDQALTHASYLMRFRAHEARLVVRLLERDVIPDLMRKVEAYLALPIEEQSLARAERLRALARSLTSISEQLSAGLTAKVGEDIRVLASAEGALVARQVRRAVPFDIDFTTPSPETLAAIVRQQPIHGRLLDEWFKDLGRKTAMRIGQQVSIGVIQGESPDEIVRRIRGTRDGQFRDGVIEASRREAATIARTAVNSISNRARQATLEKNAELLKGVMWVSTLDMDTCRTCIALDGQLFPVDSGPRPPAHPACRCGVVGVLKSWKELGVKAKEITGGMRESMDGLVPKATKYFEWLEGKGEAFQDSVLGPTLGDLFRKGRLSPEDLVDSAWRPLSVGGVLKALGA